MGEKNVVYLPVEDILYGAVGDLRREAVAAFHPRCPFVGNLLRHKGLHSQAVEKPCVQRPQCVNGEAAGDADDETPFSDQCLRIGSAFPEEDVVAPFNIVGDLAFVHDLLLADIRVFVAASAEHVSVAVHVENADGAEIVAGFALKFPFVHDVRRQDEVNGVYAPYYVLQSIENRASDFFILTIYDKNDMFCHIWKHEASHPQ